MKREGSIPYRWFSPRTRVRSDDSIFFSASKSSIGLDIVEIKVQSKWGFIFQLSRICLNMLICFKYYNI